MRDEVDKRSIDLLYIPSADQVADPLTKGLGRVLHERGCRGMGLIDVDFGDSESEDESV